MLLQIPQNGFLRLEILGFPAHMFEVQDFPLNQDKPAVSLRVSKEQNRGVDVSLEELIFLFLVLVFVASLSAKVHVLDRHHVALT